MYLEPPKKPFEPHEVSDQALGCLMQLMAPDGRLKGHLSTHATLEKRRTTPSASNGHISLVSTPICELFEALDS